MPLLIGTRPFNILLALLCALFGYLVGNFETSIAISRRKFHDDIRNHGSGNAGSTNMVRVYGLKFGFLTFLGDSIKAVIGVALGWLLMGRVGGYIAGLFVIIGHCWPVFAGFHGGKGVASLVGFGLMTCPLGALICIAVGGLVMALTRKVSLMSLAGSSIFPIMVLVFGIFPADRSEWSLFITALLTTGIIFLRHGENIRRLRAGTEPKLIPREGSRVR